MTRHNRNARKSNWRWVSLVFMPNHSMRQSFFQWCKCSGHGGLESCESFCNGIMSWRAWGVKCNSGSKQQQWLTPKGPLSNVDLWVRLVEVMDTQREPLVFAKLGPGVRVSDSCRAKELALEALCSHPLQAGRGASLCQHMCILGSGEGYLGAEQESATGSGAESKASTDWRRGRTALSQMRMTGWW